MTRRMLQWIVGIGVVLGLGGWIFWETRPEPVEVVLRKAELGQVERTVANTRAGTVEACRRAKLAPSVGGQMARLPVDEGDRVEAGALLLELWNDDLKAEAQVAKIERQASQAQAEAVLQKAELAQREADRLMELHASGTVSEEQTDRAVSEARALKAEYESAQASALRSEARLSVIQAQLARTRLQAPFAGVVAEINGELYEFVTPSPIGIVTPPAIDLIDDTCFYVTAPIDEVDAPEIRVGMEARISLDAWGEREFPGRVRRIADYVLDREKQARTVDVEVEFSRAEDLRDLLAGYSADVEIIIERRRGTLRIPTEAVLAGDQVLVFRSEEGRLERRTIRVGVSNWDFTEVLEGLSEGEQVVLNVDRTGVEAGALAEPAGGEHD